MLLSTLFFLSLIQIRWDSRCTEITTTMARTTQTKLMVDFQSIGAYIGFTSSV